MRRTALILSAAASLLALGTGSAQASGVDRLVDTHPVSFKLSSATCSNLPSGTSIKGSGAEKSITTIRTARSVTTVINATHAHGAATDQDGNTYVFNYSNEFRASNSVADPDVLSGRMTDHFSIAGNGPATVSNGFIANFTAAPDFSSFSAQPIHSHGDPITFPDGIAHCDPL